jgi:NAD(P)-dependent dehydrogenase (short-subunit alcohol dehydrogenase family)
MSLEPTPLESAPVTVVTGANSGIGRAVAIHLAGQGHSVYGTVRSFDKAAKLNAMAAEADVEVNLVELDVADDDSVAAGFARVFDQAGRVDVLVNNAGPASSRTNVVRPPGSASSRPGGTVRSRWASSIVGTVVMVAPRGSCASWLGPFDGSGRGRSDLVVDVADQVEEAGEVRELGVKVVGGG